MTAMPNAQKNVLKIVSNARARARVRHQRQNHIPSSSVG